MGDDDGRGATGLHLIPDQVDHLVTEIAVEGGGRLVEEDQTRIVHQRSADGDALLLPSGKLCRQIGGTIGQAELFQQLVGPVAGNSTEPTADLVDHQQILAGGQERDQIDGLEDEAHRIPAELGELASRVVRDLLAGHHHRAVRRRQQPAGDRAQGGLAGSRGAHERHDLVAGDGEVNVVEGHDDVVCDRVDLGDTPHLKGVSGRVDRFDERHEGLQNG